MKTILIISGGKEAIVGINRAKKLGYRVVVSDGDPQAPGFAYADHKIIASTYDIEGTIKKIQEYQIQFQKIDGVISIASDVPKTVSNVASFFNLPSISTGTAEICSNKYLMKKVFKKNNIKIPWFVEIRTLEDLKLNIKNHNQLVLKPTDSRGSRGVLKISKESNLNDCFNISKSYSNNGILILEKFIEGTQISTESIVINSKIYNLAF